MNLLKRSALPVCKMDRIICHWSEGHYRANSTDLEHYHILIEGDGNVLFGDHTIDDNANTGDGDYAAHTRGANTRAIGVACCCMVGCEEQPFQPGSEPMKQTQWNSMCQVVAELCAFYSIPVTPTTVLGHGEVQKNLGAVQRGKWDPMVWPWDTSKTRAEVGSALRQQVAALLGQTGQPSSPVTFPLEGAAAPATGASQVPKPDTAQLRSRLFAGNAALEAVAAGHLELTNSSQRREEVGLVQDALGLLTSLGGNYRIDLGASKQFRGFYGPKSRDAVLAFERDFRLATNGIVDAETILALDDAISRHDRGINPMPVLSASGAGAAGDYSPPAASAALFHAIDFTHASAAEGAKFRQAYAAADVDPHLAKGDPSNCKALLKFPKAVFFEAKMAICADGSPRALQIDSPFGQTETAYTFPKTNVSFDAEHVPYIVLPGKAAGRDFLKDFGIGKLDLGVVVANGQVTPAIYGEVGPKFRIGEASIEVHEKLPVKFPWTSPQKNHVRNASVPGAIIYLVFPGTAVGRTQGMSPDEWLAASLQAASARFDAFLASGGAA